jgi:hypothetical protein
MSYAHPYACGAPHEVRREPAGVVHRAGTDDLNRFAGQRAHVALYSVHACRNEDRSRNVAGVSAALAGLGTDEVDAHLKRLWNVLRVADHLQIKGEHRVVKPEQEKLQGETGDERS